MLEIDHFTDPVRALRSARQLLTVRRLEWLIRDTFFRWIDDNPFQMAAALAYYTLFSIAPLLLIAIAVAGSFLGEKLRKNSLLVQFKTSSGFRVRTRSRRWSKAPITDRNQDFMQVPSA